MFRFKGQKKGGVTENASYYIFTQCADGAFEAFPVHAWYNFTPVAKHRTLTAEEAEEEWGRYLTHIRVLLSFPVQVDLNSCVPCVCVCVTLSQRKLCVFN